MKNERLYLKHEHLVDFSRLSVLVDSPWGIVKPVSVDALIEMCEVKTIVYINGGDPCVTIKGCHLPPGIIQLLKKEERLFDNTIKCVLI